MNRLAWFFLILGVLGVLMAVVERVVGRWWVFQRRLHWRFEEEWETVGFWVWVWSLEWWVFGYETRALSRKDRALWAREIVS